MAKRSVDRFILFLLLSLSSVYAAQQPQNPEPSTVEGIVVDEATGEPIPGVEVHTPWPWWMPPPRPSDPADPFSEVRTDAQGHFTRDNVFGERGRASLNLIKAGYVYDYPQVILRLVPGERVSGIILRMHKPKPGGVIFGRVSDSNGNPLANVRVSAQYLGHFVLNNGVGTAESDDRGQFRLYGLTAGRYVISYSVMDRVSSACSDLPFTAGFYPGVSDLSKAQIFEVVDGRELQVPDIVPGTAQFGRVVVRFNNAGEPARDLYLQNNGRSQVVHIDAGAVTTMACRLNGPNDIQFRSVYAPPSDLLARIPYSSREENVEIKLADLHGTLPVRAMVEQLDGTIVPYTNSNSSVWIQPGPATFGVEKSAKLNASGIARFSDLLSGPYELKQFSFASEHYIATARQGERDALVDGITVAPDAPALEIVLKPAYATFSGSVMDRQGRPVVSARVLLIPDGPDIAHYRAVLRRTDMTDQNGYFELKGLAPGHYLAFASMDVNVDIANFHDVVWIDPEFLAKFHDKGVSVTIENKPVQLNLELLPN